jgi:hypothetical protein
VGVTGRRLSLLILLTLPPAWSQQATPPQAPAGIAPQWTTQQLVSALAERAQQLDPLLAQVNAPAWASQGAPDAYGRQVASTRDQLRGLVYSTGELTRRPESIALAVETLFRLQAIEVYLPSISSAVRQYQDAGLADRIFAVASANSENRDRLKQYILDLSKAKEAEYAALDQETQRCRTQLLSKPVDQKPRPAAPRPVKKKGQP